MVTGVWRGHSTHYQQQNIISKNCYWFLGLSISSAVLLRQTSQAQWWANEKDKIQNGGVLLVWTDYLSCQCGARCISRCNTKHALTQSLLLLGIHPRSDNTGYKKITHTCKKMKRWYTQAFIVALFPFIKFKRWHKYSKGYLGHRL